MFINVVFLDNYIPTVYKNTFYKSDTTGYTINDYGNGSWYYKMYIKHTLMIWSTTLIIVQFPNYCIHVYNVYIYTAYIKYILYTVHVLYIYCILYTVYTHYVFSTIRNKFLYPWHFYYSYTICANSASDILLT